jgi:streptogramin lyase
LIGLALMAIVASCSSAQVSPVTAVHSLPVTITSSPTIGVSQTPAASPTTDPASFASDPRLEACGGLEAGVQQVVALDHAWAYRVVMPGIGFVPQLDVSADPALLVIYSGLIPAKLDWRTYVNPPTTVPTPTLVPTPPPGTKNVCVALNATDAPQIVPNTALEPFHPELASLAVRPPTQSGQGRVVTRSKQSTYGLAWDQTHGVLWYTVQFPQTDSALYRLDPATGQTQRWALPATDYNGFMDMVVVDATGAVWFDQSGLRLYRLDPGSGKLAHLDINTSIKPVVDQGGVYITAIAADGDGVLIARESLPYLTRIDAGLHEVAKIQLPNSYAGSNELAVVGDRVAVGGRPDDFALFSRGGEQVATVPVQRWVAVQGPPRLLAAGPSQAAAVAEVVADGVLDVFDATGKIVSTVPLKLDLPVGPFGDMGGFESNARPQTFTTDWHGTFWYALGTYIVEVRTS